MAESESEPVPVTLDQSAEESVVRIEGEIGVADALTLKGMLLEGLASALDLMVDVGGVRAADITTLQLLWATERAAAQAGVNLGVTAPMPEELGAAMDLAGLEKSAVDTR